ncbi:MAG: hypothetical protein SVK08_00415 [Halobacteriota archaeon]|nr:hypothetical protein [Halobacteriota archaeon]
MEQIKDMGERHTVKSISISIYMMVAGFSELQGILIDSLDGGSSPSLESAGKAETPMVTNSIMRLTSNQYRDELNAELEDIQDGLNCLVDTVVGQPTYSGIRKNFGESDQPVAKTMSSTMIITVPDDPGDGARDVEFGDMVKDICKRLWNASSMLIVLFEEGSERFQEALKEEMPGIDRVPPKSMGGLLCDDFVDMIQSTRSAITENFSKVFSILNIPAVDPEDHTSMSNASVCAQLQDNT